MYRNHKSSRNNRKDSTEKRKALNTIGENSTIKISRAEENSSSKENAAASAVAEMFSSEENIPASQEPTQRYLSQRSNIASTLTRTQSRNASYRPPNTYFELVLQKAGVLLDEGDQFVLSCDHVAFVSKFRGILVKCPNYPENVATFKTGLSDALAMKSKWAQKLLSGCTINAAGEESVYQSQDSMIVNFLMIDFLRDHVLEVLLDKIEAAACDNTPRASNATNANVPMLSLLLAQMRYVTLSHGERIYARIKDIFEKCTESAKWDIIANAELILDSSRHDEFAQLLLDTMPEGKDFFNFITIQTLTNLCLSTKMQAKLRAKTLAYIKENRCSTNTLPRLIKLLLKILNEDTDDCARELVGTLREILIWRTNTATSENEKKAQLELFKFIGQGLTRSKKFYFNWQKIIAALPAHQFRSIDFMILLLLIHIKEDNSLYIENILRRRIKLEHITVEILHETKTKYAAILEQHTNILMQILHDFLKEKHKAVAEFARASYGILFEICGSIQKNILKKLLELTCDKSTQNMTNLALELLKTLQRKYPKDVQNWGMLLMPLLDRLNEMSLSQTRLVMELLCSIAYPPPTLTECSTLQDQIDMLVKKQMINRTAFVKKQGIISSVQLIDSIARIEETCIEMDDLNVTYNTVSDLPEGRGKIAANIIERVHSSTMQCPELMALFYDELACVCAATPDDRANKLLFDKPFLIWLCELMTYYFQNSFVSEHSPATTFGIQLTYQKCINSIEDSNTEEQQSELPVIAINIAELVLKPAADASSSILVLAPLFNLLRVLHLKRYEGSLEQINALLGCAIVLPTFFDDTNTDALFYDYDAQLQRKVLDIYFHCVNWMRETVSSFATQRQPMIRNKVLQRLSDLIRTEAKIRNLLLRAPSDYAPPMCQFITVSASVGAPAKAAGRGRPACNTTVQQKSNRSKTNKANQTESEAVTLNDTNIGDTTARLANTGKPKAANAKTHFDCLYGPKEIYRQMDSDIMLLLLEQLNIKYPLRAEDIGKKIGLLEFQFVLNDLVCKLESVVGVQKFQSEQTLQYIAKPHYFMSDLSKFLAAIVQNMDELSTAIAAQLEQVQRLYSHSELFTDEFNYMKVCFGLCLRLLAAYFSWGEFADASRADLLKESLLALLDRSKAPQLRSKPEATLAMEVFNKCLKYESSIVDLKTAVYAYQLAVTLKRHSSASEDATALDKQTQELRALCKQLLCRKWFSYEGPLEKGALCNIYLDELVKGFLKNSDFRRQRNILRIVLEESKQFGAKDGALKSFPNFKKANFPLLFRGLCEVFISSVGDLVATNNAAGTSDKLSVWEKSCELMNMLLDILQAVEIPRNFQLFLKHSHLYLKMVLQHGLQVYEQYLRQSPERVCDLLRKLQVSTRFLHNLCCHSKALKNTAIISQIPFLRETLETFLFRVKALLTANKCGSVFLMGILKNKDLHGDEILSQTGSLGSAATGQDSDEEIPDDDVSVDETVLGLDETGQSDNMRNEAAASSTRRDSRSKSNSRSKCF